MKYISILLISLLIIFVGCKSQNDEIEIKEDKMLKEKIAQFVPVELKYDDSHLTPKQKIVVEKLFEASQLMDSIFLSKYIRRMKKLNTSLKHHMMKKIN